MCELMHDNIDMFIVKMMIYMSKLEGSDTMFGQEEEQWKKHLHDEHP
jgi:hypothetical protein